MKRLKLIWFLLCFKGSLAYSYFWSIYILSHKGFVLSFFDYVLFFTFFFTVSLIVFLPILFFDRLMEKLKLSKNLFNLNILFGLLSVLILFGLYLVGMRGSLDFLYIFLSYSTPGFIFLNWLGKDHL